MLDVVKIIIRLFSYSLIRWVLIPILLLFLWLILGMFFGEYQSFSVLTYVNNRNQYIDLPENKLFKGDKLIGNFLADEDNLGIVAIRLDFGEGVGKTELEDYMLFRLKEEGAKDWHYENQYKTGLLKREVFYPFGFPKIQDSKGKTYIFELISLRGNNMNAVKVVKENPAFFSKYKFSKEFILKQENVSTFLLKKFYTFFSNRETLISSVSFILPFLFYVYFISMGTVVQKINLRLSKLKILKNVEFSFNKILFANFIIFIILVDILFLKKEVMGIFLGLIGFWIIIIYKNKIKWDKSILLAFIALGISAISIVLNLTHIAAKGSTWGYIFLTIGIFQTMVKNSKKIWILKVINK